MTVMGLSSQGVWGSQVLFGGDRLTEEFRPGEKFVLFALEDAGDVPMKGTKDVARKTILTVGRLGLGGVLEKNGALVAEPERRSEGDPESYDSPTFTVTSLSRPINKAAQILPQPGDFPVVAYYTTVATQLMPATVLVATGPFTGPWKLDDAGQLLTTRGGAPKPKPEVKS